MVTPHTINKYGSTLVDVAQCTLWILMFFFPSYAWPGLGITLSIATLFRFRDPSTIKFARPLFIGVVLFHLLLFAWPLVAKESAVLLGLYCIALGVLFGERVALYATLQLQRRKPRRTKKDRAQGEPSSREQPVRF